MYPDTISHEDMDRRFQGGPKLGKSAVLVLLGTPAGGRMYAREGSVWRLLEDRPRHGS